MLFKVSSIDRSANPALQSHAGDFEIKSSHLFSSGGTYALDTVMIPNTIHNVTSTCPAVSFTDEQGNQYTFNLPSGFYTNSTLITALQSAMNSTVAGAGAAATYTVTFSALTGKLTVTIDDPLALGFQFTIGPCSILGFTGSAADGAVPASSHTGVNILNLARNLALFIEINNEQEVQSIAPGGITGGGTFMVPIVVDTGKVISLREPQAASGGYPTGVQSVTFHSDARSLRIRLLDDQRRVVSLNGAEWFMTLRKV